MENNKSVRFKQKSPQIVNPYEDAFNLKWFKGDIHIHSCASPDGKADIKKIKDRLLYCSFDFAALADHNIYTQGNDKDMPVMLGNAEFTLEYKKDILSLCGAIEPSGLKNLQAAVDSVEKAGGMPILAHPKIGEFNSVKVKRSLTCENLLNHFDRYGGMEIYTSNIISGFQTAVDRLDAVWVRRCAERITPVSVWGFATSDAHEIKAITPNTGIMVASEDCSVNSLLSSIKKGRFYSLAASPARFKEISILNHKIHFVADSAVLIQLFGMPQKKFSGEKRKLHIAWAEGKSYIETDYEITGKEGFIRAEVMDRNGNFIFSNPIEISGGNTISGVDRIV